MIPRQICRLNNCFHYENPKCFCSACSCIFFQPLCLEIFEWFGATLYESEISGGPSHHICSSAGKWMLHTCSMGISELWDCFQSSEELRFCHCLAWTNTWQGDGRTFHQTTASLRDQNLRIEEQALPQDCSSYLGSPVSYCTQCRSLSCFQRGSQRPSWAHSYLPITLFLLWFTGRADGKGTTFQFCHPMWVRGTDWTSTAVHDLLLLTICSDWFLLIWNVSS